MKRIGLLSDTHSYWDERYAKYFSECDEIWHAGDIGCMELVERLQELKPLRAVYGNIDGGVMRRAFNEFSFFECENKRVLITHIGGYPRHYSPQAVRMIQSARPDIFIAGHSHILKIIYDPIYDLLHINPGAAGNYGVHKVRTAIRFDIEAGDIKNMEIGEWPR